MNKYQINMFIHGLFASALACLAVYKFDGEHTIGLFMNFLFAIPMLVVSAYTINMRMRHQDRMDELRRETEELERQLFHNSRIVEKEIREQMYDMDLAHEAIKASAVLKDLRR